MLHVVIKLHRLLHAYGLTNSLGVVPPNSHNWRQWRIQKSEICRGGGRVESEVWTLGEKGCDTKSDNFMKKKSIFVQNFHVI